MAKTIGSFDLASLKNLRDDVTQYFWFESDSSSAWGSGAHVTLYPESQFTDSTSPNYMKGQNIIMNTDGFSIRNDGLPMMVLDNDSLDFNAVDTSLGTYTTMATFGLTGATIGQTSGAHSVIDSDGQRFYASDGTTQLANIGYGEGNSSAGIPATAPYFTFGKRVDNPATYSSSAQYAKGALVKYNGKVYICKTAITTPEAWTSSHWQDAFGNYSTAEGWLVTASGYCSHAEGEGSVALGHQSHAEGNGSNAFGFGSHSEGSSCNANGSYSHAEGAGTFATNYATHAEGGGTEASGYCSHAEGMETSASYDEAHAEGYKSTASGYCSHAQNNNTVAQTKSQTAIGEFNKADPSGSTTTRGDYAFIIGNGESDDARSDALTVDWDGNTKMAGTLTMLDYDSPIGFYETKSDTVNKLTGTSFASISGSAYTPSAGRWLITASARYSGATSGNRGVAVYEAGTVLSSSQVIVPAIQSSSWATDLKTVAYVNTNGSKEYRIGLLQSSGSSLSTSYSLTFVRIR